MKLLRVTACLALLLIAGAALASADTLHVYCTPPASTCTDNSVITPTNNNPPYFAFSYSGNVNNGHGDLYVIGLVPDNKNGGFSLTLDGVNTTNASVMGMLFSGTEWSSGKLSDFMSPTWNFGGPSHPIDSYLPSTQGVNPGADGYFVYTFSFGAFDYKTAPGDPSFSVGSGSVPQGMIFLAVLTDTGAKNVVVDTPNSASLLTSDAPPAVPEPGTLGLAGSGVLMLAGFLRKRLSLG